MAQVEMTVPPALNPVDISKRMFWLAWQAVGGPFGMGVFQDNPGASEEDVWDQAMSEGDYPFGHANNVAEKMYGDYVFGRMLKLRIDTTRDSVLFSDSKPDPEYQAWARKYPSYDLLYHAAVESLLLSSGPQSA